MVTFVVVGGVLVVFATFASVLAWVDYTTNNRPELRSKATVAAKRPAEKATNSYPDGRVAA